MTDKQLLDEIGSLPDDAKRLVAEFVAIVSRASTAARAARKPKGDIADEPFVGMWRDREDMADPDYVRNLRRREWRGRT